MYKTKPIKVKVSVTLDEDLVEQLRKLAAEDDRQLSSYINIALRNHLRHLQSSKVE
nr:ribbon-helix-helix protein, CopG family [Dysosmobacter acutus]